MKEFSIVLCLVARLLVLGDAVQVRGRVSDSISSGLAMLERADAEEQSFWMSEWAAMDVSLQRLSAIASGTPNSSVPIIPKNINLNPKSMADLVPALAMLKGMYEDGKERIGKLNAREEDSKSKFAAKEAEHKSRLARIEARFQNHTLSAEFRTNETHDENRLWNYWARVRERQHAQFHTGLKIQHATLDKVKKMIDMYEKTISGKDQAGVKKELARVTRNTAPMIVLLEETRRSVVEFCASARGELAAARAEIQGKHQDPTADAERRSREMWLASHLKDVFEIDRKGRLAPQSGLNIPWDHKDSRPRNSKNDCGEKGAVEAAYAKKMADAVQKGELSAGRLSSGGR